MLRAIKETLCGQLVGCIHGIGEAARALDFPIVSGNVSLYNETMGRGILPTPAIGGVFIAGARVAWVVHLLPVLPIASVVLGQLIGVRPTSGSVTTTPVSDTLPVLVTRKV